MKEEKLISVSALMDALADALTRIMDEKSSLYVMEETSTSIENVRNRHKPLVFLKGWEEDECVHIDKVTWIEAAGSYAKFHSIGGKTQILTANLASTLRQLEAYGYDNFLRIHNSYAVNADYVTSRRGNTLQVGKKEFVIGRSYKQYFEKHIITLKK